jgi:hypothetical protein
MELKRVIIRAAARNFRRKRLSGQLSIHEVANCLREINRLEMTGKKRAAMAKAAELDAVLRGDNLEVIWNNDSRKWDIIDTLFEEE